MEFKKNETCPYPELGIYDDMTVVPMPEHMRAENGGFYDTKKTLSIDPCILDEMEYLWSKGIHTGCCCCGHNVNESSVMVDEQSRDSMLAMGYEQLKDEIFGRDTIFSLKSGCIVNKNKKNTGDEEQRRTI